VQGSTAQKFTVTGGGGQQTGAGAQQPTAGTPQSQAEALLGIAKLATTANRQAKKVLRIIEVTPKGSRVVSGKSLYLPNLTNLSTKLRAVENFKLKKPKTPSAWAPLTVHRYLSRSPGGEAKTFLFSLSLS
jgi:hypothetical protein